MTDSQSLSRLAYVFVRGQETVQSLSAYRDLMNYAPNTLTSLGKTRVIGHHSASRLHLTLHLQECVSCGKYGLSFSCLGANDAAISDYARIVLFGSFPWPELGSASIIRVGK